MDKNINEILIRSMSFAQQKKVPNKKEFVLNMLKNTLSQETYDRYLPYIEITIDLLKEIAKHPDILKGLKNNKCFLNCTK